MTRVTCVGCGLKTRWSHGSWLDRHPWFGVPARIVGGLLSGWHPTAALALAVPGTIIAFAAIATYPLVFVPLLILVGVAVVAAAYYEETRYEENTRGPTCWRADCPAMR